ncbi:MAG: molybdate ABC transporter substrate-binding protein [Hyphomicrobium sp.]|nr:molybdate ABC transporter substrate-binding protein [Hyphomicrobium sp.]
MRHLTLVIRVLAAAVSLTSGAAVLRAEPANGTKPVTVFAAASLKNVLDATGKALESDGAPKPVVSLAASSALARQIEQGAPADVFISADEDWMTYLASKDLIHPETRTVVASNTLVLIAPRDSPLRVDLSSGVDLAALLGGGRLAVADVTSVPAGKYAKAALETLGAWAAIAGHLAQTDNVRAALMLVSRGEAPLGIVYGSDAAADARVRVVAVFPAASHPPILYLAAVTKASASPADAKTFISRLISPDGRAVFAAHGFVVPE